MDWSELAIIVSSRTNHIPTASTNIGKINFGRAFFVYLILISWGVSNDGPGGLLDLILSVVSLSIYMKLTIFFPGQILTNQKRHFTSPTFSILFGNTNLLFFYQTFDTNLEKAMLGK